MVGGVIGGAELAARYRDRPAEAVLCPSGLMYVLVNAAASAIALIVVETGGRRFGLPEQASPVSVYVVQVMAAGLGAAALFRVSFAVAHDRNLNLGPIAVLHGMLRIVDGALERKRALSRLAHNDLAGLSFARDHAALTELCCHALQRFELSEAQRLGELASDLSRREDLTDADKLDCFGLELTRLVGERALRKAAERLRDRPRAAERPAEEAVEEAGEGAPVGSAERLPEQRRGERPAPEPVAAHRAEGPRGSSRLAGSGTAGRPPRRSALRDS
jgi:hypothetical protein